MADLEHILQQLHDSEINAGVQTFFDAGMQVWIGDELSGIQAEATINRTAAVRLKWPEGITAASWLHQTALRLYGESTRLSQGNLALTDGLPDGLPEHLRAPTCAPS